MCNRTQPLGPLLKNHTTSSQHTCRLKAIESFPLADKGKTFSLNIMFLTVKGDCRKAWIRDTGRQRASETWEKNHPRERHHLLTQTWDGLGIAILDQLWPLVKCDILSQRQTSFCGYSLPVWLICCSFLPPFLQKKKLDGLYLRSKKKPYIWTLKCFSFPSGGTYLFVQQQEEIDPSSWCTAQLHSRHLHQNNCSRTLRVLPENSISFFYYY